MLKLVKVISTRLNDSKRLIKFLGLGRRDIQEKNVVAPYGIDSNPVKDMVALYASTGDIGSEVIIGYINKNQIANLGELRFFSTNNDGEEQSYIYLKNNEDLHLNGESDFAVRFGELESGFNRLRQDFNNHLINYNSHIHPFVGSPSGTPSVTSPTVSTSTPSDASISNAKVDNVKLP